MIEDTAAERSEPYKRKRTGWMRFKSTIRSRVIKFRPGEGIMIKIWRPLKFCLWRVKWSLEAALHGRSAVQVKPGEVDRVYWVAPQKIVYAALQEFNLRDFNGMALGGEWDLLEKRFDSLDLYLAIRQVCQEGNKWEDTLFYQRILVDLNAGIAHYGCRNEQDLIEKCQRIEALYQDIHLNGYKSQKELLREGKVPGRLAAQEEVAVSIGRHGDLLFSDGAHRLAIARLLGIPQIPMKIAVRHTDWVKLRDELLSYARDDASTKGCELYQPVTHPDFADIPAAHGCEHGFQLISACVSVERGRLLDISANLGYFCHRFEELGFDCYAVENHPPTAYFLKRLARAENRSFKIITTSIFDALEIRNTYFDVVLALSIFHHFVKTRADFLRLVDLLGSLHMGELFFEPPSRDEFQMDRAYKDFLPEEFVEYIMAQTGLKNADFIGATNDSGATGESRPIFRVY